MVLGISIFFVRSTPLYLTAHASDEVNDELLAYLDTVDSPIKVIFFISNAMANDFPLIQLNQWMKTMSKTIEFEVIDPFLSPEISDYYDIDHDGVVVVESTMLRQDFNGLNVFYQNEHHGLIRFKNALIKAVIDVTKISGRRVLLVHEQFENPFESNEQMGLSLLNTIFSNMFITPDAWSIYDTVYPDTIRYDLVIIHRITTLDSNDLKLLQDIAVASDAVLVFQHPKFSNVVNQLGIDTAAEYSDAIIEDPEESLIFSDTQLLVEYRDGLDESRIAVVPYASPIYSNAGSVIMHTSPTAFVMKNEAIEKGPFTIAYSPTQSTVVMNTHLVPTNYWIQQADNYVVIDDLIRQLMVNYPLIRVSQTDGVDINQSIPITWPWIVKMMAILMIIPSIIGVIIVRRWKVH